MSASTSQPAEVDYHAGQGIHEFIVRLGGMRHVVNFSDDLMEKKDETDLSVVILGIVERASTQSMPVTSWCAMTTSTA